MATRFQLVMDCRDPEVLARFWAAALGYVLQPPPEGFATWDDWRRELGFAEEDLGGGPDCIIDPSGAGPRIWFAARPDDKVVKNRLHLDIHASEWRAGTITRSVASAIRKQRVDAEAMRLADLGATITGVLGGEPEEGGEGFQHYAMGMK